MLSLNNLKSFKNSKKKAKRVGRGNSSGHGTFSTRGSKGQRARTGGRKGLIKFGLKNTLQRLPKDKGFRTLKPHWEIINLNDLEDIFTNGALVGPRIYKEKGLIGDKSKLVKVLGDGKITKKLKISAHAFSKKAKAAIIKAGGEAIVIKINRKK